MGCGSRLSESVLSKSLNHRREGSRGSLVANVTSVGLPKIISLLSEWQSKTMSRLPSCVTVFLLLLLVLPPSFAQPEFFPGGVFGETLQLDKGTARWYSSQLRALHEPSLWALSKTESSQSYRFLWLRTWDHPVSVRFDINRDGTGQLVTKMSGGTGGYDPGKLILDHTREMTKAEVASLLLKFEASGSGGCQPTNIPVGETVQGGSSKDSVKVSTTSLIDGRQVQGLCGKLAYTSFTLLIWRFLRRTCTELSIPLGNL